MSEMWDLWFRMMDTRAGVKYPRRIDFNDPVHPKDFAIFTSPEGVRCITQNLQKATTFTARVLGQRANNIFADIIWIAAFSFEFTHRVDLRIWKSGDGVEKRSGELYLLPKDKRAPGARDKFICRYPEDITFADIIKQATEIRVS